MKKSVGFLLAFCGSGGVGDGGSGRQFLSITYSQCPIPNAP
ncbi:hypothetical protein [Tolypothrix sp. VBCCA 56010]